jgi:hypothetical protein
MSRNFLSCLCLSLVLVTAGCQDQQPETLAPTRPELARTATAKHPTLDLSRISLLNNRPSVQDLQVKSLARRAINPGDFVCTSTPLVDYLNQTINQAFAVEPDILLTLLDFAADAVPTYDAILFQTEATPQYFGYNGEYTRRMIKTEKDLKRFWDINSGPIQLVGMHGTMLLDVERVARVYEAAFTVGGQPIPHSLALQFAQIVHDALAASQTMDGGNWPLFSFNAFAVPGGGGSPAKIVMGDGVLESYKVIGFDDVAPQAVYAHEFGHHVQFQKGYFNDPLANSGDPAEQTRYTELMADAFGAYYLTHSRGASLNRKRVAEFLQVYFNVGDCAFDNPGHHGTPLQRMRAATFGFNVADQAQKQGHILTADQFHRLFLAAYASFVAPDAT